MAFTPPQPIWVSGGVATAQTAVFTTTYTGATGLVAVSDSGQYELAWEFKFHQILEGPTSQVQTNLAAGYYARGYTFDQYIISNARITPMRGAKSRVEIFWQNIAGYLAPDEWDVKSEDMQPHIERHPMYASMTTDDLITVRLAFNAASLNASAVAQNQFNVDNVDLCNSLYNKLLKGMENYYLAAARYIWSTYYLPGNLPALNEGGYTYAAPSGPSGYTLPSGYSWLRYADEAGQANYSPLGGIVKLTRTWIGAPNGFWDPDIYPAA